MLPLTWDKSKNINMEGWSKCTSREKLLLYSQFLMLSMYVAVWLQMTEWGIYC